MNQVSMTHTTNALTSCTSSVAVSSSVESGTKGMLSPLASPSSPCKSIQTSIASSYKGKGGNWSVMQVVVVQVFQSRKLDNTEPDLDMNSLI